MLQQMHKEVCRNHSGLYLGHGFSLGLEVFSAKQGAVPNNISIFNKPQDLLLSISPCLESLAVPL